MPSIYAGHRIKGPSALLTRKRQPAMSCLTVAVINIINYKIHWIERSKESKYFHGVPCRWWQNLCKYCPWQIRTPSLYPQTDKLNQTEAQCSCFLYFQILSLLLLRRLKQEGGTGRSNLQLGPWKSLNLHICMQLIKNVIFPLTFVFTLNRYRR